MALCGLLVSSCRTQVFKGNITYTGKLWSNSLQLVMDEGDVTCTFQSKTSLQRLLFLHLNIL